MSKLKMDSEKEIDFKVRAQEFEKYFSRCGFRDFEMLTGWPIEDFKRQYEIFKVYVTGVYKGYCKGHNYEYEENEVRYPLVADICSYVELKFFVTMGEDFRVKYPSISILKEDYYVTLPPQDIEFLECEEVMRRIMLLDYLNREFFEEGRELTRMDWELDHEES